MENYIYKFIDYNDAVIYVGKTGNIYKRMAGHFTRGHLPRECYDNVAHIYYAKVGSQYNAEIFETYYIEKYHPVYNTDKKYREDEKDADLSFPDVTWREFYFERVETGIKFLREALPYTNAELRTKEQADMAVEMNLNIIRYHFFEIGFCKKLMKIADVQRKLEEIYRYAGQNVSTMDCDFNEFISDDAEEEKASHIIAFCVAHTRILDCFGEMLKAGLVQYMQKDMFCLPMLCKTVYDRLDYRI